MTADRIGSGKSDLFYNMLAPFHDFAEFVEFNAYEPVPDDWIVMTADVQGSTRAIEGGHYKNVNMVGAASITAVLNTCGDIEVPFVFGGDGGTVVVPGSRRKAAGDALIGLQAISRTTFGLSLRVGAIPVADLRAQGTDVRVRKYQLIPTVIDQNPCAHLRMPRDMIFHGWSMRLFQAWQHSATMSS